MRRNRAPIVCAIAALFGVCAARADGSLDVYKAMGIPNTKVLSGSVLTSRVFPGNEKQTVAIVTFFTGASKEDDAVNVVLEVFRKDGEKLVSLWKRDLARENGGKSTHPAK